MANGRVQHDDEDLLRVTLTHIGQDAPFTRSDEIRFAKAIEAGKDASTQMLGEQATTPSRRRELELSVRSGEIAERQFVQSNLGLVVTLATKYQASGVPLLDLIQEGNVGLIYAVKTFDWREGSSFSRHATWWIRQAITRGIARTPCIRLSSSRT